MHKSIKPIWKIFSVYLLLLRFLFDPLISDTILIKPTILNVLKITTVGLNFFPLFLFSISALLKSVTTRKRGTIIVFLFLRMQKKKIFK